MTLKLPKSMDECIYFTNRSIRETGSAKAWVFKKECPQCKKVVMAKPRDPKTGKPKIRSKEYVCPSCNYTEEKKEHEETLNVCIIYKCPECSNNGEIEVPFKRKNVQILNEETGKKSSVKAIQFNCQKCEAKINITKKMK
jgi:ribosomal protein S27AE